MTKRLSDDEIDQMADGFVGTGGHRAIPFFGFDPHPPQPPKQRGFPGIDETSQVEGRKVVSPKPETLNLGPLTFNL